MSQTQVLQFFAPTPKGLELLLKDELQALGATDAAEKLAGVSFSGDLSLAYKACLWSRLANRILLKLKTFRAETPEQLYAGVQSIAWDEHLNPDGTLIVNFISANSQIDHTLYGAQKVKDAIVDQFRDQYDERPSVLKYDADVTIHVFVQRDEATLSIDLSGESLHRRGYRLAGGAAPLKENLAAAILIRAGWPALAKEDAMLLDPMCGSGTLLIEGAMMAGDIAPGLQRAHFGFTQWKQHKPKIWDALYQEALDRQAKGVKAIPTIIGYDADPTAIKNAFDNIERAGLRGKIHVEKRELENFAPKAGSKPGLVATNPPYGERLGELEALEPLYTCLGERLKTTCQGWKAAVFTGNPDLGKVMGLRAKKFYALFNGPIPCKLLLFDVNPEKFIDRSYADKE